MAKVKDPEDALFWFKIREAFYTLAGTDDVVIEFEQLGRKAVVSTNRTDDDEDHVLVKIYTTVNHTPQPLIVP